MEDNILKQLAEWCVASTPLMAVFLLLASSAYSQGKIPVSIQDDVVYKGKSYGAYFSQYEREDVRSTPGTGELQKEWIDESYVEIGANENPQLGSKEAALARRLAAAFCKHYGLTVLGAPKSIREQDGIWTFLDLCWKEGW